MFVVLHRVHHKFTETDADPHNARRGFFFSHIGWLMVRKHKDVFEKGATVDMSDLEKDPIVMFQKKLVFFEFYNYYTSCDNQTKKHWMWLAKHSDATNESSLETYKRVLPE